MPKRDWNSRPLTSFTLAPRLDSRRSCMVFEYDPMMALNGLSHPVSGFTPMVPSGLNLGTVGGVSKASNTTPPLATDALSVTSFRWERLITELEVMVSQLLALVVRFTRPVSRLKLAGLIMPF